MGEHIRKVRMDRGLLQREVAEAIGVDLTTVLNWEIRRSEPALRNWPGIIQFLGYVPLKGGTSLADRLKVLRQLTGRSQARLADTLAVDESTLRGWEHGNHFPNPCNLKRLEGLFTTIGFEPRNDGG
ncbi:MAG: helix-turn-helix transcriptional regulator [Gemmatimonadota bacterium]